MVKVRTVQTADADAWLRMRRELWPEEREGEHAEEVEAFFAGDFPRGPWQVLLAEDADGRVLGFAEVSIRPYAEGCSSARVAYLEGWFVEAEARGRGVGGALMEAVRAWGREQGCRELASDAEPENRASVTAHLHLGFEDAGLVRCFRMDL